MKIRCETVLSVTGMLMDGIVIKGKDHKQDTDQYRLENQR